MILLENNTRAGAPNADYPFGFIVDENGSNNGTFIDSNFLNDLWQLKEKMFDESGLVANGLPDNLTNGFQLFQAFMTVFGLKKRFSSAWNMDTTAGIQITHGISDITKVRDISAIVASNSNILIGSLFSGGSVVIDDTYINLTREASGGFDDNAFNAATVYVSIELVP
jgi:hypothetical protein